MRIIYTKHFPPGNFHGINLFGIVFVQRRWGRFLPHEVTHEMVHTYQQRELLFILFFLLYLLEYLVRLVQYRFNTFEAYRNISFEREAFAQIIERYLRKTPDVVLRELCEKELPRLAKGLEVEGDYYDLFVALMEVAAEERGLEKMRFYTDTELLTLIRSTQPLPKAA